MRAPHRGLLVFLTAVFLAALLSRLSRPPAPPTARGSRATLEALLSTLHRAPVTPLQVAYRQRTRCARKLDIRALRHSLPRAPAHPLVVCAPNPLSPAHLHIVRKLAARFGPPFLTTPNPAALRALRAHNITPLLPRSPLHALSTTAHAAALLVQPAPVCAVSARLADGVVYYTNDYLAFIANRGYEWLPATAARLDGFDRRHRAVLSALGVVEQSCCTFQQGICAPLKQCTAVVLGQLQHTINCTVLLSTPCTSGCPAWKHIIANGIPHVLILDISGYEFSTLHHLSFVPTRHLPRQIVVRMRVWSLTKLSSEWKPLSGGWIASRNLVMNTVLRLRKRGFRLVHRVDDHNCEWCAFLTFLRD